MDRYAQDYFTYAPTVSIGRTVYKKPFTHKTSFNAGLLIPLMVEEVLPGTTYRVRTSFLLRSQTPIRPVMDDSYLDIYHFFVPNRLSYEHWSEVMGENTAGPWAPTVQRTVPQLQATALGSNYFQENTVADYMGIPTHTNVQYQWSFNHLPFRDYALIWNEFFRDENLDSYAAFYKDDTSRTAAVYSDRNAVLNATYSNRIQNAVLGGAPLPVNRFHDYFSSCLPQPQKGDPQGVSLAGIPITTSSTENIVSSPSALKWRTTGGSTFTGNIQASSGTSVYSNGSVTTTSNIYPTNLVIGNAKIDVNSIRFAFAMQRMLEKDMFGTRYTEMLKAHFGVTNPDYRLQRPEFLGGKRVRISQNQVVQTSSTDSVTPQGSTAAYSLTSDSDDSFVKSFTEHGFILSLACVRHNHTYQQGVERFWMRKSRFDYYDPCFANIGYQPVYKGELYTYGNDFGSVFGYNEAWADYRYKPARVSGAMRSNYNSGTLDSWHYADYYTSSPSLSAEWLKEGRGEIDRTLAISSSLTDQFFGDFLIDMTVASPMPVHSTPGLVDHH